jgi:broad specificity phosphatase PhoE
MEVLIIRHGQSEYNAALTDEMDSKMTTRGFEQVSATGEWLENNFDLEGYQGIVSPYLRALQTAEAIRKATGLMFVVDDRVREHDMRAERVTEIPNRKEDFSGFHWYGRWPRTYIHEDIEEFFDRMKNFQSCLEDDEKYLIVTHGSPSRTLHTLLSGKNLDEVRERYLNQEEIDSSTSLKNSSLTYVADGKDVWFSKTVYDWSEETDKNAKKDCS